MSAARKAQNLHDAEPEAWRSAPPAAASVQRQAYDRAVLTRDAIGRRMRTWDGPRSGAAYEGLVGEWVAANRAADLAYDAMIEEACS
jgi:hypothetical protein